MDLNRALATIRPFTQLAGIALIAVGLLKYFGVAAIAVGGGGLELAVAGFLCKSI